MLFYQSLTHRHGAQDTIPFFKKSRQKKARNQLDRNNLHRIFRNVFGIMFIFGKKECL